MFNIVPSNRWITVVVGIGLLALIVYGVVTHNPTTIVIIIALLIFSAPVTLLAIINWRERRKSEQFHE